MNLEINQITNISYFLQKAIAVWLRTRVLKIEIFPKKKTIFFLLLLQLACDFVIILNQLYFYRKKIKKNFSRGKAYKIVNYPCNLFQK